jgi:hypothetical protein
MMESKKRSFSIGFLALIATAQLSYLSVFAFLHFDAYKELISGLGEIEIPLITSIILVTCKYWGVLVVFPLLALIQEITGWNYLKISNSKIAITLGLLMVSGILIAGLSVYAMYLPIFRLEDVA